MQKWLTLVLAAIFSLSVPVFPQTAPVKYLAGRSESGQPHLYWFGAAAEELSLYYDDGTAQVPIIVSENWADNQVLVRFGLNAAFFVINKISAFVFPNAASDTASLFALTVHQDTGSSRPGPVLGNVPVEMRWNGQTSAWAEESLNIFIAGDTSFWGALNWLQSSPTNPHIGDDRSDNLFRTYIGYQDSFFLWKDGGNLMIRAKVLVNNSQFEAADSFRIYRSTDSILYSYAATAGAGQFDFRDMPGNGNFYYRVTRWQNGEESGPSNAVLLSSSPTSVKDREKNQSFFLLSEPYPNPFSTGVLFTARTERQMELGFSIYNLLGQKVFSLSPQNFSAGEHRFFWKGDDGGGRRLPSGPYFLQFRAGEEVIVKKLLLLR
jgi:hypothetical protein